jgi:hypothetical protein
LTVSKYNTLSPITLANGGAKRVSSMTWVCWLWGGNLGSVLVIFAGFQTEVKYTIWERESDQSIYGLWVRIRMFIYVEKRSIIVGTLKERNRCQVDICDGMPLPRICAWCQHVMCESDWYVTLTIKDELVHLV